MRFAILLLALVACQSEGPTGEVGVHGGVSKPITGDGPLAWLSSYPWHVDGLWIPAAVDWGVAGMGGRTCQMGYTAGSIDADLDFGDGTDTVFGGYVLDGGDTSVLVGTNGTIHSVTFPGGDVQASWEVPNAVTAAPSDLGPVVLSGESSCRVEWPDAWDVTVGIAASPCDGEFAVDPDGTAFVATDGRVVSARPDHAGEIASDVDHLAWSSADQLLYVASATGSTVRALDRDGAVLWSADVGGRVEGLAALGDGSVAVSVVVDVGESAITVVADGAIAFTQPVHVHASRLVASDDGAVVALVAGGRVDYFRVDRDRGGR